MNELVKDYAVWLDQNIISVLESGEIPSLDQYVKNMYGEERYNEMLDIVRKNGD
jgi:hypothetical protein